MEPSFNSEEAFSKLRESIPILKREINKIIVGQDEVIHQLLISILARGHSIFVGVPGLAKTTLINTLANALHLNFSRVQFTPDLMPSDITGAEILEEDPETGRRNFRFFHGPLFANIVLADEINRSSPKTQSALLQAMQEYSVTVAGKTYELDLPFLIFATQNPIEQEGTFPLPEAQLDRFMLQINVEYQSREEEIQVLKNTTTQEIPKISPVLEKADVLLFQKLLRRMPVPDEVFAYTTDLIRKTRPNAEESPTFIKDQLLFGAGPRGGQTLILAAKGHALLDGRYTVNFDDVHAVIYPVLRHRLILSYKAEAENIKTEDIIQELLKRFAE